MKYSFLIPYYNRLPQFRETLYSFKQLYGDRKDFEVVVIIDAKQTLIMTDTLIQTMFVIGVPCIPIHSNAQNAYNPATAYNEGARIASGQYLILTSPECLHEVDILAGLDEEFKQNPEYYIICACRVENTKRGGLKWYQHSIHRPLNYHFCSALSREIYNKVGGFDERYTTGYGYDDDSFRDRVLAAGVEFKTRDDLVVLHQSHEKIRPADWRIRLQQNRSLYLRERHNG